MATSLSVGYGSAASALLAALLLAATARSGGSPALIIGAALLGLTALLLAATSAFCRRTRARRRRAPGLWKRLMVQLTPVVCLSAAYPMVGPRLEAGRVGSVSEQMLVLAGSLVTPWLSQTVCSPLFRALSVPADAGQPASLPGRWLALWPLVAVQSILIAALAGLGTGALLGWDSAASGALVVLCALNGLLSQSMVVGILQRNYMSWAYAWAAYAAALVVIPAWWFLPPLAGLLTQLISLARMRPALARPGRTRGVLAYFCKGALIGAVLWSDKLLLFLRDPGQFHALLVFLAALPAIVTYGYYFVRLAPDLDQVVADMRATMENDRLRQSAFRLRELSGQVEQLIVRVTCVGAALCLTGVTIVSLVMPAASMLYAAMAVASTIFMINTALLYKLEYIGRGSTALWFAGAHLAAVSVAFAIGPPGTLTYLVLAALEASIVMMAARSVLAAWRVPDYSLFWRRAVQW